MRPRALITDDEEQLARLAERAIRGEFQVDLEHTLAGARRRLLGSDEYDVVLMDIHLPDGNGLDLLRECRVARPDTPFVMMTADSTVERAVEAMKLGAMDFLGKPFDDMDLVLLRCRRAVELRALARKARHFDASRTEQASFSEIVGKSRCMQHVFDIVASAAPSVATVLVDGESGTGKELVARAIHARSPRRDRPFLPVNCAALQETLLESELFGYVRGAFTGATSDKKGLFEAAHGGTLFLDEIGDMGKPLQAKLLRVLQDGEVRPVGSTSSRRVDVRIVAATNRDLRSAMKKEEFREDLYYRLSVINVTLPPLRERAGDLPELAYYFVRKFSARLDRPCPELDPFCLELLCQYSWPGNVRELENVIERAVVLTRGGTIEADALPPYFYRGEAPGYGSGSSAAAPSASPGTAASIATETMPFQNAKMLAIADFEKRYLTTLMERCKGNISLAAREAGLDRSNFKKVLRKHDLTGSDTAES